MQRGSLAIISRKEGPAVWQFRWSEKDLHGSRVQRKRVIGTVKRYPNEAAARSAIVVLLAEINSDTVRMGSRSITVAQLCDHFEQRELAKDNTWRSYSTKKTYQAYLKRTDMRFRILAQLLFAKGKRRSQDSTCTVLTSASSYRRH
jgi:hypothetical protein